MTGTYVGTGWEFHGAPHYVHLDSVAGSEVDVSQEVLDHSVLVMT